MRLTLETIRRLPKAELHCHLDGSLRPRTVLELAKEQGVELPTTQIGPLTRLLEAGKRTRNLGDYLKIFDLTLAVMQRKEALYRTAFELVEDCAAESVRHLEVRYSPILHRKKRLPFEDIVDPVIAGLRDAGAKYGMSTGVIICGIRSMGPKVSMELAELAVAYKGRGVLAFDLAGQEKDYPAKEHREAFQLILKHNINSTVHGARHSARRASARRCTTAAPTGSGMAPVSRRIPISCATCATTGYLWKCVSQATSRRAR